jgi:hypothetical protein
VICTGASQAFSPTPLLRSSDDWLAAHFTQDNAAKNSLAVLSARIDSAEAQAAVAQQEREASRVAAQLREARELREAAQTALGNGELDAAAALLQRAATACALTSGGGEGGHEGAAAACAAEVELISGTITATRAANAAAEEALQREAMLQAAAEAEAERQAKEKEALEQAAVARKLQEQAAAAAAAAKEEELARSAAAAKLQVELHEMLDSSHKTDTQDSPAALSTAATSAAAPKKEDSAGQVAVTAAAEEVAQPAAAAAEIIAGAAPDAQGAGVPLPLSAETVSAGTATNNERSGQVAATAPVPPTILEKVSVANAAAAQDIAEDKHRQASGTYTSTDLPLAAPAVQTSIDKAGDNESAAQSTNVCVAGSGGACLAPGKDSNAQPVPAATTAPAVGVGMGVRPVYVEDGGERRQTGLEVSRLVNGGPAAASGRIRVGDSLEAVDGVDVRSLPVRQLSAVLAGLEGSSVRLGLRGQAEGAAPYEVELVRAAVTAR